MKKVRMLIFFILSIPLYLYGGDSLLEQEIPSVFIDCENCDMDFIKTEISFVNYVRERKEADVYILISRQRTGSGGRKYTLIFSGQNRFALMDDTLYFFTEKAASEDLVRRKMVKTIKIGLMRYIARTSVSDNVKILFANKEREEIGDRWNHWVFTVTMNGFLNGEESMKSNNVWGKFSINRITEDWKIDISFYSNYNGSIFKMNDTTIIESFSMGYGAHSGIVMAMNDHWSVASGIYLNSSTYNNIRMKTKVGPAIEYNIFPYSQSTSRMLRIDYMIGYSYSQYYEETIYDKTKENLFGQELSINVETKQKWGSIKVSLSGSHYFHDFTKNRLTINGGISLHILRGLSLNLAGNASLIHDQLSLPKRDLTHDEILLRRKQLATQYDYFLSVGFAYSFGSIYSNIVNPRFGD